MRLKVEEFQGRKFFSPATDVHGMAARFATTWHIDAFMPYVKGNYRVLQAGGNMGQWPIYLADHFEMVHTFEASPLNFQCMCLNTGVDFGIVKSPYALGAESKVVYFEDDAKNCEGSFVAEQGVPVQSVALDSIFMDGRPVDAIILDVEGQEFEALKGARSILEKWQPALMLEFREFERPTFDHDILHAWLGHLGYTWVKTASKDRIYVHD